MICKHKITIFCILLTFLLFLSAGCAMETVTETGSETESVSSNVSAWSSASSEVREPTIEDNYKAFYKKRLNSEPLRELTLSVADPRENRLGIYSPVLAEFMQRTPDDERIPVRIVFSDFHYAPYLYKDVCDPEICDEIVLQTKEERAEMLMRRVFGDELVDQYIQLVQERDDLELDWENSPHSVMNALGMEEQLNERVDEYRDLEIEIGNRTRECVDAQIEKWANETYLQCSGKTLTQIVAGQVNSCISHITIEVELTVEELLELEQAEWVRPSVDGIFSF